jgi:hypothetical protein
MKNSGTFGAVAWVGRVVRLRGAAESKGRQSEYLNGRKLSALDTFYMIEINKAKFNEQVRFL